MLSSTSDPPGPDKSRRDYRFISLITVLNVTFQLTSDITAGKIINFFGSGVSATIIFFPFTYIIGDIITEVYGYSRARQIVWLTLLASIIAAICYSLVAVVPAASFFDKNEAYVTVFSTVPRILFGGWLAVFLGDFANDLIVAKLKVRTKGRLLWLRLILSTVVGQLINTSAFYLIGLWGILPLSKLFEAIVLGWILKSTVEIVLLPITYMVIKFLKRAEKCDYFDHDTNFNPFSIM